MKTAFFTPIRPLPLKSLVHSLGLLVLAFFFSGCSSTTGLLSRRPVPPPSATIVHDWDHPGTETGELTIALVRWTF